MKKTILYLFFVFVLINSVYSAWFVDNSTFNPNTFQYQTYWTGNKFKLISDNANKINIIIADSVSANICAVFDVNSFTYLSDNFTFSGNNCSITYNFLNDTEYIIGLYRSDSYAYNQYYISVATPFNTNNIKWYGYITNNILDNWTFIDDYISDFGYMEINLSIPEIPPVNITPNITQNQTGTNIVVNLSGLDSLWLLIFAIFFIILAIVLRVYILISVSALGFLLISLNYLHESTLAENLFYYGLFWAFLLFALASFIIGVGLAISQYIEGKKDKFYKDY